MLDEFAPGSVIFRSRSIRTLMHIAQMPELTDTFRRMKELPDKDTAKLFTEKILPL
jgi:hypothetical protein